MFFVVAATFLSCLGRWKVNFLVWLDMLLSLLLSLLSQQSGALGYKYLFNTTTFRFFKFIIKVNIFIIYLFCSFILEKLTLTPTYRNFLLSLITLQGFFLFFFVSSMFTRNFPHLIV